MKEAAALGFRAHSGWAVAVAVAGSPNQPIVLERRRIEIADAAIPGSRQPFHAAEDLDAARAEALISRCRESSQALATAAISRLVVQFSVQHSLSASGMISGSGRPLPDLSAILRSHALLHTAEGEFFREVLARASESCSLPVKRVKEREVWDRGAEVFHLRPETLQQQIQALGRSLGPPWRQDEKLASLAAWIALAESV